MKFQRPALLFVLVACFFFVQFASFIDEPEHYFQPDPDCPYCLMAKTPLDINPVHCFNLIPDIVFYLHDSPPPQPINNRYATVIAIRAPPSHTLI